MMRFFSNLWQIKILVNIKCNLTCYGFSHFKIVVTTGVAFYFFTLIPAFATEQNIEQALNQNKTQVQTAKHNLQNKYYRQALYYYFQGDYTNALKLINQAKAKLRKLDDISQLFAAGLQVNMGLQVQAKENLESFGNISPASANNASKSTTKVASTNEAKSLLLVARLSLAEQYIEQGEIAQAQQTLAKIKHVNTASYQQYQVLSQLAYWPKKPPLVVESNDAKSAQQSVEQTQQSPYVQLNIALRIIEQQKQLAQPNYQPAIVLLEQLKTAHWQAPKRSFWQLLFSNEEENQNAITKYESKGLAAQDAAAEQIALENNQQLQYQAINDYAQLLLAQVYVQQQQYERAFYELKSFPQQSPFTESALFLFAFSAQQIKQYTMSLSLLTLLHQQYPYSNLGWQAGLLKAEQLTQEQGLSQGFQAYQNEEAFFEEKLHSLNSFAQTFSVSQDLLNSNVNQKPASIWLQQALNNNALAHLVKQLNELQQLSSTLHQLENKSQWLAQTIELNKNRMQRLASSEKAINQQAVYEKLVQKHAELADILQFAVADPSQSGYAFANVKEQELLDRLNISKESYAVLMQSLHNNASENIDKTRSEKIQQIIDQSALAKYKQRIARIESMLNWQLKKQFPERAWQHKQLLAQVEKQLANVTQMKRHIANMTSEQGKLNGVNHLSNIAIKQQSTEKKLEKLVEQRSALSEQITHAIQDKITRYVTQQRTLITQHLLNTRREMASILEQMAIKDKKIESQLNIHNQANNTQHTNETEELIL